MCPLSCWLRLLAQAAALALSLVVGSHRWLYRSPASCFENLHSKLCLSTSTLLIIGLPYPQASYGPQSKRLSCSIVLESLWLNLVFSSLNLASFLQSCQQVQSWSPQVWCPNHPTSKFGSSSTVSLNVMSTPSYHISLWTGQQPA